MQIRIFIVEGLITLFYIDEKHYFNKEKRTSIGDRWIHIVLTKNDSKSNYQIWIDGQYTSKLSQYHTSFNEMERSSSLIDIAVVHKFNISSEVSRKERVVDLNAFKRCLTLVDIRAIHQQKTSLNQVKFGTYVNSNNLHIIHIDCRWKSNYFSCKFIFLFLALLILLIFYFL